MKFNLPLEQAIDIYLGTGFMYSEPENGRAILECEDSDLIFLSIFLEKARQTPLMPDKLILSDLYAKVEEALNDT